MTLSLEEMKANRRKWVEALRSGKYEQCSGNLYDGESYCCLGVLAKVAGLQDDDILFHGTLTLHRHVLDFVGLSDPAGGYGRTCLADRNDKGASFKSIARTILREPAGLFIDSTPTGSAS